MRTRAAFSLRPVQPWQQLMLGAFCVTAIWLHAGAAQALGTTKVTGDDIVPLPAVPETLQPESGTAGELVAKRIVFRGNTVVRTAALNAVADAYLNKNLSEADIEELRVALTRQYVDRGYINSGVILDPDAPPRDGQLSFLIIEGRVKEVRVKGLKHLRHSYVVDRLAGPPGEVLNSNALRERYQRLLDDPLFARINTRIEPTAVAGEAVLDVDVERTRPYSLSWALNNYRPPSIGEKAYDLGGQLRNLTGLGDTIDADVTGPVTFDGGVGYYAAWTVPFDHLGGIIALSAGRSQSVITTEPLAALDIRSTVEREELRIAHPLFRTSSQDFALGVGVARERNSTTLAGEEFSFLPGANTGLTRSITVRVIPEYSFRSERQFLGIRVTLLHANLQGQSDEAAFYAEPDHSYYVYTGQIHYLYRMPQLPFELESRFSIQETRSRISDIHSVALGGVNSVRGFRENEILAAKIRNANFDLRWLALPPGRQWRPELSLGPFFDWASGRNVDGPVTVFSSTGASVRAKWPHLQVDLAYGVPLIQPTFVRAEHGSWQDHGIHVQIAASL